MEATPTDRPAGDAEEDVSPLNYETLRLDAPRDEETADDSARTADPDAGGSAPDADDDSVTGSVPTDDSESPTGREGARWQRGSSRPSAGLVFRLLNRPEAQALIAFATLYVLFFNDIRLLLFTKRADPVFEVLSLICLVAFALEILARSWAETSLRVEWVPLPLPTGGCCGGRSASDPPVEPQSPTLSPAGQQVAPAEPARTWRACRPCVGCAHLWLPKVVITGYLGSFIFLLDLIAIASLFPEIDWLWSNNLFADGSSSAGNWEAARGSRIARIGSRLGRIVRVVRLARLVKLYSVWRTAATRQERLDAMAHSSSAHDAPEHWQKQPHALLGPDGHSRPGSVSGSITEFVSPVSPTGGQGGSVLLSPGLGVNGSPDLGTPGNKPGGAGFTAPTAGGSMLWHAGDPTPALPPSEGTTPAAAAPAAMSRAMDVQARNAGLWCCCRQSSSSDCCRRKPPQYLSDDWWSLTPGVRFWRAGKHALNMATAGVGAIRESQMGQQLADATTRAVLVLVLLLVLIVPIVTFSPDDRGPYVATEVLHRANMRRADGWENFAALLQAECGYWTSADGVLDSDIGQPKLIRLSLGPSTAGAVRGDPGFVPPEVLIDRQDVLSDLRKSLSGEEVLPLEYMSPWQPQPNLTATTSVLLNMRPVVRLNSLLTLELTLFIIALLLIGALVFIADAQALVLTPIEKMIAFLERVSMDPTASAYASSRDNTGSYETKVLENTIKKIVGILRVAFGNAGVLIVARYLEPSSGQKKAVAREAQRRSQWQQLLDVLAWRQQQQQWLGANATQTMRLRSLLAMAPRGTDLAAAGPGGGFSPTPAAMASIGSFGARAANWRAGPPRTARVMPRFESLRSISFSKAQRFVATDGGVGALETVGTDASGDSSTARSVSTAADAVGTGTATASVRHTTSGSSGATAQRPGAPPGAMASPHALSVPLRPRSWQSARALPRLFVPPTPPLGAGPAAVPPSLVETPLSAPAAVHVRGNGPGGLAAIPQTPSGGDVSPTAGSSADGGGHDGSSSGSIGATNAALVLHAAPAAAARKRPALVASPSLSSIPIGGAAPPAIRLPSSPRRPGGSGEQSTASHSRRLVFYSHLMQPAPRYDQSTSSSTSQYHLHVTSRSLLAADAVTPRAENPLAAMHAAGDPAAGAVPLPMTPRRSAYRPMSSPRLVASAEAPLPMSATQQVLALLPPRALHAPLPDMRDGLVSAPAAASGTAVDGSLLDPFRPGRLVRAVFVRLHIPHFDAICAVLGERATRYSNAIAKVVHDTVLAWGGSPIANTAHGFLCVWSIDDAWSTLAAAEPLVAQYLERGGDAPGFLAKPHAHGRGAGHDHCGPHCKHHLSGACISHGASFVSAASFERPASSRQLKGPLSRRSSLGAVLTGLGDDTSAPPVSRSSQRALSTGVATRHSAASTAGTGADAGLDRAAASRFAVSDAEAVGARPPASRTPGASAATGGDKVSATAELEVPHSSASMHTAPIAHRDARARRMMVEAAAEMADRALIACLKIIAATRRSADITESDEFQLLRTSDRLRGYRLDLQFGIHVGWGIECVMGTSHKVDACYLGQHVDIAANLQQLTSRYDTNILASGSFAKLLTTHARGLGRKVDAVHLRTEGKGLCESRPRGIPLSLVAFDVFDWHATVRTQVALSDGAPAAGADASLAPLIPFTFLADNGLLEADMFNRSRRQMPEHDRCVSIVGAADIIEHPIVVGRYARSIFVEDRELVALTRVFSPAFKAAHDRAMDAYIRGAWGDAKALFAEAAALMPPTSISGGAASGGVDPSRPNRQVYASMAAHDFVPPPEWDGRRLL